jgi:YVTN family beta-propeller protein
VIAAMVAAVLVMATRRASGAGEDLDRSPLMLALSPDGTRLYTANRTANSMSAIDTGSRRVLKEIKVGAGPAGIAVRADGKTVFVANCLANTVSAVDAATMREVKQIKVGNQPFDVLTAADGMVYVANVGKDDSVSVIDGKKLTEVKQISVAQNPRCLALSPDGKLLYVTCDVYDIHREVCVIDLTTGKVAQRISFEMASNLRGVAVTNGHLMLVAHLNPKPFAPMTQVQQGWVNTNAVSFVFLEGEKPERVSLLLDEVIRYHANPYDIALTPDGRFAYVTCGGDNSVQVVDIAKAVDLIKKTPAEQRERLGNTLGLARNFVTARINVGRNPFGIVLSPDGKWAYVANHLDSTVSVINTETNVVDAMIDVGSAPTITPIRRGEILFNGAFICFQRQFTCASCHPEGHATGISWDLEDDGLGNPKNIKSFRGVKGSQPFRWQGEALEIGANECAPTVTGGMRGQPLTDEDLNALALFVETMPLLPNPHRGPRGELSAAAKRGEKIFTGKAECVKCHPLPATTNNKRADIGTGTGRPDPLKMPNGQTIYPMQFDVPHLRGAWDSAPYLHDGRAKTLYEVFTQFNPDDKHGKTKGLTKQELDDLVAFVQSL